MKFRRDFIIFVQLAEFKVSVKIFEIIRMCVSFVNRLSREIFCIFHP